MVLGSLHDCADDALVQTGEKGYLIPYALSGKKLVKVGVSFSKETRNVEEVRVEK